MGAGFTSLGVALRGGFGLVVETAAMGRGGGGNWNPRVFIASFWGMEKSCGCGDLVFRVLVDLGGGGVIA